MHTALFSHTPTVTVLNNRGLTVRDIAYHRHPDTPDITRERITRHLFDARGFLTRSADPRLHDAGLANFAYLSDLTGTVLRSVGVDNGITYSLSDAAGRPFITISNISSLPDGTADYRQVVTRTWQYEDITRPGRPLSVTEQVAGEAPRITERFVWAGSDEVAQALNLAGECIRHYDAAGMQQTDRTALTGGPLSVTRRLLKDADNPDAVADWQGPDASAWDSLLTTEGGDDRETHTTLTTADATGAVLTTTDAKGNVQRVAYDVAGQLSGSWLTLQGGSEQVIVRSLTYSAAGQKLREEHGNGVVTTYTYEAETQRLTGIKTERPAGHASGARVLQDLRYQHDPVGNVLKISNDAEETRFWRNQKVVPESTYVYDSLYQLVRATGREMANVGQQGSNLPSVAVPLSSDGSAYTNYTRTYTYDEAGNLTQVRHTPATGSGYTTKITVSDCSNRGVLSTLTENATDVDALFTTGGQQKHLLPGLSLVWTPRNELLQVMQVVRDGSTDDSESYRYDADGQRVLKTSVQKTSGTTQMQRVVYLPGLELRTTTNGNTETESLQVLDVGKSSRTQGRVLHWESGKPEAIGNDQLRWSYGNLIGSCGLEVDNQGYVISMEEYYPYGGTAILTARSQMEVNYKNVRYSGKERDAAGLYYYGRRYYQPWVGRWLSVDPASTVDGLNLFRMVQNNPETLYDGDGLSPIAQNFNKERGDMVYGLGITRGPYINRALGYKYTSTDEGAPAAIIDLYNNTVSKEILSRLGDDNIGKIIEDPKKHSKKIQIPSNLEVIVSGDNNYPLWRRYFSIGEKNKKFNIGKIYKEVQQSPGSSQYHEWAPSLAPKLLWKRGSKLGIETAADGFGNKIHFILDKLDITSVISKQGPGGQSITASELRYAYRNRDRLKGALHFYKNDEEVNAPWETAPEVWSSYKSKKENNSPSLFQNFKMRFLKNHSVK